MTPPTSAFAQPANILFHETNGHTPDSVITVDTTTHDNNDGIATNEHIGNS